MPQSTRLGSRQGEQFTSLVTRACDMCRQKKIRCDVVSGVCAQCIKYKTPCHFTPISMKRAPRRSGKDKRIEELKKRLKSMEDQLKSSNIAEENSEASDVDALLPNTSLMVVAGGHGTIFPHAPSFDSAVYKGRAIIALPPKDRMLSLIEKSFQGFHSAYPLFDKANFMSIFDSLDASINDSGRWACLNVVLALTPQFWHAKAQDMIEDRETWSYFQNALAVVSQLMTMHVTLWSVQALLGMAIVVKGTPNQGPFSVLTSSAIKLAHRLGLHRRCQNPNISAAETEERKRVFWIAYSLDKDLSLQLGQPPTQDDDDMDVEFPSEYESGLFYPEESTSMTSFNCRTRLAVIQGQIYKRLCSVKATKQTVTERVVAARELEAMLQSWRASVPIEFMQDYHESPIQMQTSGTNRHPIILQLSYFNSLAIIYNSLPVLPMYRELQGTADPMEYRLLSAPLIYAAEARKAIKLLQVTPRRKYACIWAVLHIFVTATTTLLKDIVSDPSKPMAQSDLTLIEPLLKLLAVLSKSSKGSKSGRITEMHQSCMEMFERAKIAVESINLAGIGWGQSVMSGRLQGRENLEDFLRRMENIRSGYDMELDSIAPGISREFAFAVEHQFQESTSI